jgi:hypothetical protein
LFSLFLLLSGCRQIETKRLEQLYGQQEYERTVSMADSLLRKSIYPGYLFWGAKARYALDKQEAAYHDLSLYLAMAGAKDVYFSEANRLMCVLALRQADYHAVVASAGQLENLGEIDPQAGSAWYQALSALGRSDEAARVFSVYLKDTIDPLSYAKLLVRARIGGERLTDAVRTLDEGQTLALLEFAVSATVPSGYAGKLLAFAVPLEDAYDGKAGLSRVYAVLAALYGYSDQRVLERKYSTLSTKQ